MTRIWALLAAASCAPAPSPPPLLGPEGPVDLSGLPLRSVSADDPIAGAAKLVGVEASAALERAGIDTSTVAFVCSDGYRARVPRDAVEREGALLVFARTDGAPFESMAGVDLSPYYL